MNLSLKVLGGFVVQDGSGAELTLPTRKTRALLGYLALHSNQSQPREKLTSLLWSDRGEKQARHSLNQSVRAIRKLGRDAGLTLLDTDADSVRLIGNDIDVDALRFRSLLDGHPTDAAALYRGPLLDGLTISDPGFSEWLDRARAELNAQACRALERSAVELAQQGQTEAALKTARNLVSLDPLLEEGHRLLMRQLYEAGDRAGAVRQYHACVEILRRELEVEPDNETISLYETIRRNGEYTGQSRASPRVTDQPTAIPAPRRPLATRPWIGSAALTAIVLVVGTVIVALLGSDIRKETPQHRNEAVLRLPDVPSIAVLPFDNLSSDPEQTYFADGMTEDLITDLSRVPGLFVIARNSTFAYKGKAVNFRQVGAELGVRYILEGSVRKTNDQVRINAQLIDIKTGGHLWAERYDGSWNQIFALQDRVAKRIVMALTLNLTKDDVKPIRRYTASSDAYEAFLKGWVYYQRFSADDFTRAVPYFEQAIHLDPNYGRAYAALASLYWKSAREGYTWTSKVSPDSSDWRAFTSSRFKVDKYLELAMRNPSPLAYQVASATSLDLRQFNDAIDLARKSVALDPNDPDGYVALAWAMIYAGHPEEALAEVERAMRLDPKNTAAYFFVHGMALLGVKQYTDALKALLRAQEKYPEHSDVNFPLAVVLGELGRKDEARVTLARYTGAWKAKFMTLDGAMAWWPFKRESDIRLFGNRVADAGLCCRAMLEPYIENLRRGGTLE